MPSVTDIVTIAEALEKCPVAVAQDRCVAVRSRNASCRKCARACAFGAITVVANRVEVAAGKCVGCGACVAACPTEALMLADAPDGEVASALRASLTANVSRAVVACARIASKRQVPAGRFAEVPCLARLEPSLLLGALSAGAAEVLAVDGDCATCKHRDCTSRVDAVLEEARVIARAHGSQATIARQTGFPDELKGPGEGVQGASTRRGFFSEALGAAKETTMTAARVTIAKELGAPSPDGQPIGERLRVGGDGKLPTIRCARHEAVLNSMDAIGKPQPTTLSTSLFATIDIDLVKCNACGMCATFCPTTALVRDVAEKASSPLKYLEFSACDCVQCGLCADVCWKGALTLSPVVDAAELYDFEPRIFKVAAG